MNRLPGFAARKLAGLANRLQTQGGWVTLAWFYGHGLPRRTGIPIFRFGRVTDQIYLGTQIGPVG